MRNAIIANRPELKGYRVRERNTWSVYLITKTKDKRRQFEHIKTKNDGPKQDHVHKRSEWSSESKRNHKARMYIRKMSTEKEGKHQLMRFNRKWWQDIWKRAEVAPQSATRRFTYDGFQVHCLNAMLHQDEITNQDLTKKGNDLDQLIDIVKPENRHRHSRTFLPTIKQQKDSLWWAS